MMVFLEVVKKKKKCQVWRVFTGSFSLVCGLGLIIGNIERLGCLKECWEIAREFQMISWKIQYTISVEYNNIKKLIGSI